MRINTTRFGRIDVDAADVLTFPSGLPGLEDCREWALLADATNDAKPASSDDDKNDSKKIASRHSSKELEDSNRSSTSSWWVPTMCLYVPLCATSGHFVPLQATVCYNVPLCPPSYLLSNHHILYFVIC